MTKQVKRVSELPGWFDLRKYKAASELDFLGWYWQLSARCQLNQYLNNIVSEELVHRFASNPKISRVLAGQKAHRKFLEYTRNHGVFDISSAYVEQEVLGDILEFPRFGVRDATASDIRDQLEALQDDQRGETLIYLSESSEENKLMQRPLLESQKHSTSAMLIAVDLGLPETLLMENFATLLRQRQTKEPRFRTPDVKEWIRIGLLPFLDLNLWALEESNTILNRVFADAIFEGDQEGEEVVRKTTEKLAYAILNGDWLRELATLHFLHDNAKAES